MWWLRFLTEKWFWGQNTFFTHFLYFCQINVPCVSTTPSNNQNAGLRNINVWSLTYISLDDPYQNLSSTLGLKFSQAICSVCYRRNISMLLFVKLIKEILHVTLWSPAWKGLTDLLAVLFVVFCHFPKYVLVHIRIKGDVGAVKLV